MDILSDFALDFIKIFYANYSLSTTILSFCIMGVVYGLVQLLKPCIKHFTKKIKNERLRKLANKTIIGLSFAISIGIWFLLELIAPRLIKIDWVLIFLTGASPVVAHALYDGVITKGEAKSAVEDISNVVKDKKIDKKDSPVVKELLEKLDKYDGH